MSLFSRSSGCRGTAMCWVVSQKSQCPKDDVTCCGDVGAKSLPPIVGDSRPWKRSEVCRSTAGKWIYSENIWASVDIFSRRKTEKAAPIYCFLFFFSVLFVVIVVYAMYRTCRIAVSEFYTLVAADAGMNFSRRSKLGSGEKDVETTGAVFVWQQTTAPVSLLPNWCFRVRTVGGYHHELLAPTRWPQYLSRTKPGKGQDKAFDAQSLSVTSCFSFDWTKLVWEQVKKKQQFLTSNPPLTTKKHGTKDGVTTFHEASVLQMHEGLIRDTVATGFKLDCCWIETEWHETWN